MDNKQYPKVCTVSARCAQGSSNTPYGAPRHGVIHYAHGTGNLQRNHEGQNQGGIHSDHSGSSVFAEAVFDITGTPEAPAALPTPRIVPPKSRARQVCFCYALLALRGRT